jgi:CDP-diacylglycerol--serine O-phosphatidyltransferase
VLFALFCVYGLSGYVVYAWRKFKGKPVSVIATSPTSPTRRACTAEALPSATARYIDS